MIGDEIRIWDGTGMITGWDKYMEWTRDGCGYGGGDGKRMWGHGYGMDLRWLWEDVMDMGWDKVMADGHGWL